MPPEKNTMILLVDLDNISFYDSSFNEACAFDRLSALFTHSWSPSATPGSYSTEKRYNLLFCNHTTRHLLCSVSPRREELLSKVSLEVVASGKQRDTRSSTRTTRDQEKYVIGKTSKTSTKSIKNTRISRSKTQETALFVAEDDKDSADHALLNAMLTVLNDVQGRNAHFVVVSADKTLARLVTYFWDRALKRVSSPQTTLHFAKFHNTRPHACTALQVYDATRFPLHFNDSVDLNAFMGSLKRFHQRYPAAQDDAECD